MTRRRSSLSWLGTRDAPTNTPRRIRWLRSTNPSRAATTLPLASATAPCVSLDLASSPQLRHRNRMKTVTIQEATSSFPTLLADVEEKGETVLICRGDKPVAELKA